MRLPSQRDLTDRQKEVYLYAPLDEHTLVAGPPGTGKTLIACLRAIELVRRGHPVQLLMFNRVLSQFTRGPSDMDDVPVMTVQSWLTQWWRHSGLPPHTLSQKVMIDVDYGDREKVKAMGARWDPNLWRPGRQPGQYKKGAWYIDGAGAIEVAEDLARWRLWPDPPKEPGDMYTISWDAAAEHLVDHADSLNDGALHLGMLIIDEGQDFPPGMYRFLRRLAAISSTRVQDSGKAVRCMVLADENQQITEYNSTLSDIQQGLAIQHQYDLPDNFRNTREVARFASWFYSDTVTGTADLPQRRGEVPARTEAEGIGSAAKFLVRWVRNHPRKEVGVLAFRERDRAELDAELREGLSGLQGRNIRVQTYSSQRRQGVKPDDLVFDRPDTVTVLNVQSAKGLEFDAVFLTRSLSLERGSLADDRFRMRLFVAVARARDYVYMLDEPGVADALVGTFLPEDPQILQLIREDLVGGREHGDTDEQPEGAENGPSWAIEARDLAARLGAEVRDLRDRGGAFWIALERDSPYANELARRGFRHKPGKGWWRK